MATTAVRECIGPIILLLDTKPPVPTKKNLYAEPLIIEKVSPRTILSGNVLTSQKPQSAPVVSLLVAPT